MASMATGSEATTARRARPCRHILVLGSPKAGKSLVITILTYHYLITRLSTSLRATDLQQRHTLAMWLYPQLYSSNESRGVLAQLAEARPGPPQALTSPHAHGDEGSAWGANSSDGCAEGPEAGVPASKSADRLRNLPSILRTHGNGLQISARGRRVTFMHGPASRVFPGLPTLVLHEVPAGGVPLVGSEARPYPIPWYTHAALVVVPWTWLSTRQSVAQHLCQHIRRLATFLETPIPTDITPQKFKDTTRPSLSPEELRSLTANECHASFHRGPGPVHLEHMPNTGYLLARLIVLDDRLCPIPCPGPSGGDSGGRVPLGEPSGVPSVLVVSELARVLGFTQLVFLPLPPKPPPRFAWPALVQFLSGEPVSYYSSVKLLHSRVYCTLKFQANTSYSPTSFPIQPDQSKLRPFSLLATPCELGVKHQGDFGEIGGLAQCPWLTGLWNITATHHPEADICIELPGGSLSPLRMLYPETSYFGAYSATCYLKSAESLSERLDRPLRLFFHSAVLCATSPFFASLFRELRQLAVLVDQWLDRTHQRPGLEQTDGAGRASPSSPTPAHSGGAPSEGAPGTDPSTRASAAKAHLSRTKTHLAVLATRLVTSDRGRRVKRTSPRAARVPPPSLRRTGVRPNPPTVPSPEPSSATATPPSLEPFAQPLSGADLGATTTTGPGASPGSSRPRPGSGSDSAGPVLAHLDAAQTQTLGRTPPVVVVSRAPLSDGAQAPRSPPPAPSGPQVAVPVPDPLPSHLCDEPDTSESGRILASFGLTRLALRELGLTPSDLVAIPHSLVTRPEEPVSPPQATDSSWISTFRSPYSGGTSAIVQIGSLATPRLVPTAKWKPLGTAPVDPMLPSPPQWLDLGGLCEAALPGNTFFDRARAKRGGIGLWSRHLMGVTAGSVSPRAAAPPHLPDSSTNTPPESIRLLAQLQHAGLLIVSKLYSPSAFAAESEPRGSVRGVTRHGISSPTRLGPRGRAGTGGVDLGTLPKLGLVGGSTAESESPSLSEHPQPQQSPRLTFLQALATGFLGPRIRRHAASIQKKLNKLQVLHPLALALALRSLYGLPTQLIISPLFPVHPAKDILRSIRQAFKLLNVPSSAGIASKFGLMRYHKVVGIGVNPLGLLRFSSCQVRIRLTSRNLPSASDSTLSVSRLSSGSGSESNVSGSGSEPHQRMDPSPSLAPSLSRRAGPSGPVAGPAEQDTQAGFASGSAVRPSSPPPRHTTAPIGDLAIPESAGSSLLHGLLPSEFVAESRKVLDPMQVGGPRSGWTARPEEDRLMFSESVTHPETLSALEAVQGNGILWDIQGGTLNQTSSQLLDRVQSSLLGQLSLGRVTANMHTFPYWAPYLAWGHCALPSERAAVLRARLICQAALDLLPELPDPAREPVHTSRASGGSTLVKRFPFKLALGLKLGRYLGKVASRGGAPSSVSAASARSATPPASVREGGGVPGSGAASQVRGVRPAPSPGSTSGPTPSSSRAKKVPPLRWISWLIPLLNPVLPGPSAAPEAIVPDADRGRSTTLPVLGSGPPLPVSERPLRSSRKSAHFSWLKLLRSDRNSSSELLLPYDALFVLAPVLHRMIQRSERDWVKVHPPHPPAPPIRAKQPPPLLPPHFSLATPAGVPSSAHSCSFFGAGAAGRGSLASGSPRKVGHGSVSPRRPRQSLDLSSPRSAHGTGRPSPRAGPPDRGPLPPSLPETLESFDFQLRISSVAQLPAHQYFFKLLGGQLTPQQVPVQHLIGTLGLAIWFHAYWLVARLTIALLERLTPAEAYLFLLPTLRVTPPFPRIGRFHELPVDTLLKSREPGIYEVPLQVQSVLQQLETACRDIMRWAHTNAAILEEIQLGRLPRVSVLRELFDRAMQNAHASDSQTRRFDARVLDRLSFFRANLHLYNPTCTSACLLPAWYAAYLSVLQLRCSVLVAALLSPTPPDLPERYFSELTQHLVLDPILASIAKSLCRRIADLSIFQDLLRHMATASLFAPRIEWTSAGSEFLLASPNFPSFLTSSLWGPG